MKRFLSILLCIVTVLSLCACDVNSGNDFILGVYGTITSFDPVKAENDVEKIISTNCFESLLRFDENGNISLAGATAYTIKNDGLTYTFELNPNAQWNITKEIKEAVKEKNIKNFDKTITAQDYVYGFEYYKKAYNDEISNVESFTATNKHTLEIRLKYSDPDLLYKLASLPIFPLNKSYYEASEDTYGKDFKTILFNGPYCVTASSDAETVIEKNSVYNGNIQIQNKKILLYTTGTEELMQSRYENSTYNVFIGDEWYPLAGENAKLISTDKVWGFAFNCKTEVGSVQGLRYALLNAINRSNITLPDFASSNAKGIIPDSFLAGDKKYGEFVHEAYSYPNNTKSALSTLDAILKEQNKKLIEITFAAPEEMKDTAENIILQWESLFKDKINVTLTTFKAKDAQSFAQEGKYDIGILPLIPESKTANGLINSIKKAPCYYEDILRLSDESSFSTVTAENIDTYNIKENEIIKNGIFVPLFYTGYKLYYKDNTNGIYIADGGSFIYFYKGVQK